MELNRLSEVIFAQVSHDRDLLRSCRDEAQLLPQAHLQRTLEENQTPNSLISMIFPAAVPEIPAASVDKAVAYYVGVLGFTLDWVDQQSGIAGISRGKCRLFITDRHFREADDNKPPILFWLNLDRKAEVDELFAEWKAAQAKIVSEPEDKPWMLREFVAADPDGNLIRVFYDFKGDPVDAL